MAGILMSAMPKKAARAVVSVVILFGAVSLLLFTTMSQGAQPYLHVDEVAKNANSWYGKEIQLHGFANQVKVKPSTLEYQFDIEKDGHVFKATYQGVVPDTFKDGAEVVIKGKLSPHGFQVNQGRDAILAKCPSKYEAAGPAAKAN
jgi:cytochrome c-type biogenesis protein CcmE